LAVFGVSDQTNAREYDADYSGVYAGNCKTNFRKSKQTLSKARSYRRLYTHKNWFDFRRIGHLLNMASAKSWPFSGLNRFGLKAS